MSLRCNGLIKAHGQRAQHSSFLKLFTNTWLSLTPRRAPWRVKIHPHQWGALCCYWRDKKLDITFSTTHLHLVQMLGGNPMARLQICPMVSSSTKWLLHDQLASRNWAGSYFPSYVGEQNIYIYILSVGPKTSVYWSSNNVFMFSNNLDVISTKSSAWPAWLDERAWPARLAFLLFWSHCHLRPSNSFCWQHLQKRPSFWL